MAFNGFGTQTAWPDGTGFAAAEGEISNGRTFIRDLCQGISNCVRKQDETSAKTRFIYSFTSCSFSSI